MICINCGGSTSGYTDICENCQQEMDEQASVDVNKANNSPIVDTQRDFLFQRQRTSGAILDDDPDKVRNYMNEDDDDKTAFFKGLGILVAMIVIIVILFQ